MAKGLSKKSAPRRRSVAYVMDEPSFALRMPSAMREHPADSAAIAIAACAAAAIVVNALFLQPVTEHPVARRAVQAVPVMPIPRPSITPVQREPAPLTAPALEPAVTPPAPPVREAQTELLRRGFYDGPADGVAGPKTEMAVRLFEASRGLPPTGQITPRLMRELRGGTKRP